MQEINIQIINSFFDDEQVKSDEENLKLLNIFGINKVAEYLTNYQKLTINEINDKNEIRFINNISHCYGDSLVSYFDYNRIFLFLSLFQDLLNFHFNLFEFIFSISLIILFYIFINIFITKSYKIINNYSNSNNRNIEVKIRRNSIILKINAEDIILGDLIILEKGIVPINGILLKGNIEIFQSENFRLKYSGDPFIIAGSYILEGDGEMIACSLFKCN